eukprot:gene11168-13197_t
MSVSSDQHCATVGQAMQLHQELLALGIRPNILFLKALLVLHLRAGQSEPALALLTDLKAEGFTPDQETLDQLVMTCAIAENWAAVKQVQESLVAQGLKPSTQPLSAVLLHYYTLGAWETVTRMHEAMIKAGLHTGTDMYQIVLSSCNHQRAWHRSARILEDARDLSLNTRYRLYRWFLTSLASAGEYDLLVSTFLKTIEEKLGISVDDCSQLQSTCRKVDEAVELWENHLDQGQQVTASSRHCFLHILQDAKRWKTVREVVLRAEQETVASGEEFDEAKKSPRNPHLELQDYQMLLNSYCQLEQWNESLQLFLRLAEETDADKKPKLSIFMWRNATWACEILGKPALWVRISVLILAKQLWSNIDEYTFLYCDVIFGLGSCGHVDRALQFFEQLLLEVEPHLRLYNAATQAAVTNHRCIQAVEIMRNCINSGATEPLTLAQFEDQVYLNLHGMNGYSAQVLTIIWLAAIMRCLYSGHYTPFLHFVSIITGKDRHRHRQFVPRGHRRAHQPYSVKDATEALLSGLNAPFHVDPTNTGRYISPLPVFLRWMHSITTSVNEEEIIAALCRRLEAINHPSLNVATCGAPVNCKPESEAFHTDVVMETAVDEEVQDHKSCSDTSRAIAALQASDWQAANAASEQPTTSFRGLWPEWHSTRDETKVSPPQAPVLGQTEQVLEKGCAPSDERRAPARQESLPEAGRKECEAEAKDKESEAEEQDKWYYWELDEKESLSEAGEKGCATEAEDKWCTCKPWALPEAESNKTPLTPSAMNQNHRALPKTLTKDEEVQFYAIEAQNFMPLHVFKFILAFVILIRDLKTRSAVHQFDNIGPMIALSVANGVIVPSLGNFWSRACPKRDPLRIADFMYGVSCVLVYLNFLNMVYVDAALIQPTQYLVVIPAQNLGYMVTTFEMRQRRNHGIWRVLMLFGFCGIGDWLCLSAHRSIVASLLSFFLMSLMPCLVALFFPRATAALGDKEAKEHPPLEKEGWEHLPLEKEGREHLPLEKEGWEHLPLEKEGGEHLTYP